MANLTRFRCAVLGLALVVSVMFPGLARADAPTLSDQLTALEEKYSPVQSAAQPLAEQGKIAEANSLVANFTPDAQKSPAESLYVGNLLYHFDPLLSYRFHKAAFTALPGEPAAALEWAMELHRAGEHAAAVPAYRAYLASAESAPGISALLADCLLHTGAYGEALAAWQAANQPSHHSSIEELIHEIYGKTHPQVRRGELLTRLRSGDSAAAEELIDLDLRFDYDWWNEGVNEEALALDRAEIGPLLAAQPQRLAVIDIYASVLTGKAELGPALQAAGLLVGPNAKLPENGLLAGRLVGFTLALEVATAEDLLLAQAAELRRRGLEGKGDVEFYNALAGLAAAAKAANFAEIERTGWERFAEERFAGPYLAGRAAKGPLRHDDPELVRALAAFPRSSFLQAMALERAEADGLKGDALLPYVVAALRAEYTQPMGGMAPRDSYRLKAYFAKLSELLAPLEPAGP